MKKQISLLLIASSLILYLSDLPIKMQAQEKEPIAYIGHGAFFDQDGKPIELTQEFVARSQNWYRTKLLSNLRSDKKNEFVKIERGIGTLVEAVGQERLLVQQYLLDMLIANSPNSSHNERVVEKLDALKYIMRWKLPYRASMQNFEYNEKFKPSSEVERKLELFKLELFKIDIEKKLKSIIPTFNSSQLFSDSVANGEDYKNKCEAAGVPIPPSIGITDGEGKKGWKSLGFIPKEKQFVGQTSAELLAYQSNKGMCMALLRYSGDKTTITDSGVICVGNESSNACFWDNQRKNKKFDFPRDCVVPIGIPNTESDRYLGGGDELADSFMCTDCHAGQNPYIIHPKVKLEGGPEMGQLNQEPLNLPTFSRSRYIPIVKASWPQNQPSDSLQPVPSICLACHLNGVEGGAFPRLSSNLKGYCKGILPQAIKNTMPVGDEGNHADDKEVKRFLDLCNSTDPFNSFALASRGQRKSTQPPLGKRPKRWQKLYPTR